MRRGSNTDDGGAVQVVAPEAPSPSLSPICSEQVESVDDESKPPITWMSLPNKWQLCVILLARLAEPLSERSLTTYLFYQLRWFDSSLSDGDIARQAGFITSAFAAAQCVTSMVWGYAADDRRCGRKRVLIIGLLGTCISAIGIGFSRSYASAMAFRIIAGALNGNIVVLRTLVSEVVEDKRYQSRAFLLLPMCYSVGVIIGPMMGGILADPVHSLPTFFGPGSFFGGTDGVTWLKSFPYALPNIACAAIIFTSMTIVFFGLDETHPDLKHKRDTGRTLGKIIFTKLRGKREKSESRYRSLPVVPDPETSPLLSGQNYGTMDSGSDEGNDVEESPGIKGLGRKNVILVLLQQFLLTLHISAYNAAILMLFPATRSDNHHAKLPFFFNGGLGLSARKIGFANSSIGFAAIASQILLYPWLSARFGTLSCYRMALPFTIISYLMIPFLVLLPKDSPANWPCLILIMSLNIFSRSFIGPGAIILVNNSAPHPSLLGTMHGFASSIASAARMIGPIASGAAIAASLKNNIIGAPFWGIALLALMNWLLLVWARHETVIH